MHKLAGRSATTLMTLRTIFSSGALTLNPDDNKPTQEPEVAMESVKTIEIRPARKSGHLRAFADVKIGNMMVTDFRIFQENGGRPRVEVPMVTWRDPETRGLRFKPVITLPGELMGRVQAEILSCYYRVMEEKKSDHKP